jgi:glycosyltransferase involved in cell wall biosynthesis
MACGIPVVATDVGGNAQVVTDERLGVVTPFGDTEALGTAIDRALRFPWERSVIRAYAAENAWERRIPLLLEVFDAVLSESAMCRTPMAAAAVPGGRGVD